MPNVTDELQVPVLPAARPGFMGVFMAGTVRVRLTAQSFVTSEGNAVIDSPKWRYMCSVDA